MSAPPQLRTLVEQHASFALRSLRQLGVPEEDVERALRDSFVSAYARLARGTASPSVRACVYASCARVAGARAASGACAGDACALGSRAPFDARTFGEQLLHRLPLALREVLFLYEVENMPVAEIAAAVGCSVRRARARLLSARARIVADVERIAAEGDDDWA